MNEIQYQAGLAVVAVHVINWMKDTKLVPFVTEHTAIINRIIALAAAVIGGLGIHFANQGDLSSGGTLQIMYPSLDVMVTSAAHIGLSWGIQQVYFRQQGAQRSEAEAQHVAVPVGDVLPVQIVNK